MIGIDSKNPSVNTLVLVWKYFTYNLHYDLHQFALMSNNLCTLLSSNMSAKILNYGDY